jgi:ribosomal protein S18 acetylase RimI-like enzyme
VIVRRAEPDDAAALAALARETFIDAFGADNTAEDMAMYTAAEFGPAQQRREIVDPNIVTLLIDDVAYAQLRRTPGAVHGDVELARFYVRRAHHGRGVAQALMSAVVAEARALGATALWLGVWERNARAIAFYRKCGFERCGAQPFLLGRDLQSDWIMRRTKL